jgi:glucokinase
MNNVNPQAERLVGVEVSGSALKAVCLDKNGALVDSAKISLDNQQEILAQLTDFTGGLKSRFGDFNKIGVALPGLLNRATNRITISKHLPENTGLDLAQEIRQRTGLEAVLENDANAAAYAEHVMGAGRGSADVFYVTLGVGVGGAFIFNGKLWRGASGFAGELGYITINSDGMTLEEVASANSIIRRIRTRVQQDHTSSLARIREEDIRVSHIVEAANTGDDLSRMMLERTGSYVGTAIANVINLLNIGKIVVGGEIMGARHIVLDAIKKSARELSFKPSFETTEIVAGELGENAVGTGAALLSANNG